MSKKKWWEVARTQDEMDLFNSLARHPKYAWRSGTSLLNELNWDAEKFKRIVSPYLQNSMISVQKKLDGSFCFAYWERIKERSETTGKLVSGKTRVAKSAPAIKASSNSSTNRVIPVIKKNPLKKKAKKK